MPAWVADHDKWERAKKAVHPSNEDSEGSYYARVTTVYKKMGGRIKRQRKLYKALPLLCLRPLTALHQSAPLPRKQMSLFKAMAWRWLTKALRQGGLFDLVPEKKIVHRETGTHIQTYHVRLPEGSAHEDAAPDPIPAKPPPDLPGPAQPSPPSKPAMVPGAVEGVLYNAPPPSVLETDQSVQQMAAKYGRVPVPGATPQTFCRSGLAQGVEPDKDGTLHTVKGKRYLQVAHTKRVYHSEEWLHEMDMFTVAPGGYYEWSGIEVEATKQEIQADQATAKRAQTKAKKLEPLGDTLQVLTELSDRPECVSDAPLPAEAQAGSAIGVRVRSASPGSSRMRDEGSLYVNGDIIYYYHGGHYDDYRSSVLVVTDPVLATRIKNNIDALYLMGGVDGEHPTPKLRYDCSITGEANLPSYAERQKIENAAEEAKARIIKAREAAKAKETSAGAGPKKPQSYRGTFARLRSGEWGIRIEGKARTGEKAVITKRDGGTSTVRIGEIVWSGEGTTLATIAKAFSPIAYLLAKALRQPNPSAAGNITLREEEYLPHAPLFKAWLLKALRQGNRSRLIPMKRVVRRKTGTHEQTYYIRPGDASEAKQRPSPIDRSRKAERVPASKRPGKSEIQAMHDARFIPRPHPVSDGDYDVFERAMSFETGSGRELLKSLRMTKQEVLWHVEKQRILAGSTQQTKDLHYQHGDYSLERTKVHHGVLDTLFNGLAPATGKPTVLMTGGYPGAGKSSILKQKDLSGYVQLDSDTIKGLLAAADGIDRLTHEAAAYHAESNDVLQEAFARAIAQGYNVVLDHTMRDEGRMLSFVERFRSAGYDVKAVYADLPMEKAIHRAIYRSVVEGRFVDPAYIVTHDHRNIRTLESLKQKVDAWEHWNTDVSFGQPAKLVAKGGA